VDPGLFCLQRLEKIGVRIGSAISVSYLALDFRKTGLVHPVDDVGQGASSRWKEAIAIAGFPGDGVVHLFWRGAIHAEVFVFP
jgi:hypothetical protein